MKDNRRIQPAPDDGEAACIEIAVVEVDSIGLVRGGTTHAAFLRAATKAYAAGRLAAFREAEEIARKEAVRAVCSEADRIAGAIAARAKEGT